MDARWACLALCLLLLPTLILVFLDRRAWPWDEAFYGTFSVSLFHVLVHSPLAWPSAMLHALGDRPPMIAWLGQLFVPLGYRVPLFQSALLLLTWIAQATSVVVLFLALRKMFQETPPALLASAIMATGPLFTALTTRFFVEPLQVLSIVWLFALTAYQRRMSRPVLFLQATAAVAFGLLVKTSTPLFAFPIGLFLIGASIRRGPAPAAPSWTSRGISCMSLAGAALMASGAFGWYAINHRAAVQHVIEASSGTLALYYGSQGSLLTKVSFWLTHFQRSYFCLPLSIAAILLAPRAIAVRLRHTGGWRRVDLLGLLSVVWIAVVLLLFSCNVNEDIRYLLGLAPYVAFALCWLAAHLESRILLIALGLGCLGQFIVVTAQDYGLMASQGRLSDYLQPYVRDERALRDSIFCAANTVESSPQHITIIGTQLADFNAEGVGFYHAVLLGGNGTKPSYPDYQGLSFLRTTGSEWRRVREGDYRYYVYRKHDPAQDADEFNRLSNPVFARVATSSEFHFRPDKSNDRVLVFERGHGGPRYTGLFKGFQGVTAEGSLPFGRMESPQIGDLVEGAPALAVAGWAVCPFGIAAIEIQLDGRRVADASTTRRPDVEKLFPGLPSTGYSASLSTDSLPTGVHEVAVLAHARDGGSRMLSRVPLVFGVSGFQGVNQEGRLPFGWLELPGIGESVEGGANLPLAGWAASASGIAAIEVQLDGRRVAGVTTRSRPDVEKAFPKSLATGYSASLATSSLPVGTHEIKVLVHARDGASRVLSRVPVVLKPSGLQGVSPDGDLPFGFLDTPRVGDSVEGGEPLMVAGWAAAASGVPTIEIQLDGRRAGGVATMSRPDVERGFPQFPSTGFSVTLPASSLPAGPHEITVLAHGRNGAARVLARVPVSTEAASSK
jgi:hypothetical protein